jgi:hypothetical protein
VIAEAPDAESHVAPIVGTLGLRAGDVDDRRGLPVLAYRQP